jgi:hypothetical protein
VIGDEGGPPVLLAPGHLRRSRFGTVVQPVGVHLIGAEVRDDLPDGVPVDPEQPLDRRLFCPRRQPRDELLEVAGQPAGVAGERDALDPDPVLRALQPAQPGAELQPPDPEIEVAPDRLDLLAVMPVRRGELAQRAPRPPTAQRDPHHHPVGIELHPAHPDPVQAQQAREFRVDAHRRPPCKRLTFDSQQLAARGRRARPASDVDQPAHTAVPDAARPTSMPGAPRM